MNKKILTRYVKEAGIEYHKMEEYKWLKSEELGYDAGSQALVRWCRLYGDQTRKWIRNMSDRELDEVFESLPERIKRKIYRKCSQN